MAERKTCTIRRRVLQGAHVEAEFPWIYRNRRFNAEQYAKELERACKDFVDFLRDHRSQDLITLSVERELKDFCSACGHEWEADNYDGETHCAWCDANLVEESQIPTPSKG